MNATGMQKCRGTLFGAAVGDALAFPYEGLSSVFTGALDREALGGYRRHRDGRYPLGQGTYLVQLTMGVLQAACHDSGIPAERTVGSYLYPLARDGVLVKPPPALCPALKAWAEGIAVTRRELSVPPLHLLPLAILPGVDHEDALRSLPALSCPTGHQTEELVALGSAFLAAVRFCVSVEDIVLGDLLDACCASASRFSQSVARDINVIVDLLARSERDVMNDVGTYGTSSGAAHVVAGLVSFLKSPFDAERSLLIALRSAGGCPTAFVCGALSGAFLGEEKIPWRLRSTLEAGRDLHRCLEELGSLFEERGGRGSGAFRNCPDRATGRHMKKG